MRADWEAARGDNMTQDPGIFIGRGARPVYLLPRLANRHGLIAGATGTGKTVTLQVLAEEFSRRGVPVFLADIKGDLSGIAQPGAENSILLERAREVGLTDYRFESFPVQFWDLFGRQGHRVRATVSEMGPLLFSRLLGLSEAQEGVL
jgi:DNA helicase HerA-like ATPase